MLPPDKIAELKQCLKQAAEKVWGDDQALFHVRGSEWSIAHRLALYLEPDFPGWNVDCEYNRQGKGHDPKILNGKRRRPDISIHHRTHVGIEDNLLLIEIKKKRNSKDSLKVSEFTKPPENGRTFQYQFGVAISFLPERELFWFFNGEKI